MILPLAHFGHVLIDAPLFGGPIVVLIVALVISTRRERRRERDRAGGHSSA